MDICLAAKEYIELALYMNEIENEQGHDMAVHVKLMCLYDNEDTRLIRG